VGSERNCACFGIDYNHSVNISHEPAEHQQNK
jgi:hypothetical protein